MTINPEALDLKDLPFLNKNLKRIDKAILQSLPPKNLSKISKAIHYSVLNGGKRIRPQLVLLMAETLELLHLFFLNFCLKRVGLLDLRLLDYLSSKSSRSSVPSSFSKSF